MPWTTTGDIHELVDVAGPFLESDPVANTVLADDLGFVRVLDRVVLTET